MKKILLFLSVIALMAAAGCKKEGPQGPAGPQGIPGKDGKDGLDGKDASVTCKACHNSTTKILAAQKQYENSLHHEGETVFETRTTCAACHTNEGFNECIVTGADNTAAEITNPTRVGCYTCHYVHKNYDSTDLALKNIAPVKMRADVNTVIDFGKGNMCLKCHQPRTTTPSYTTLTAAKDNDTISVTSSRFGPHHGAQGTMLAGKIAYEIAGSKTYTNGPHTATANACVQCHMATPFSDLAGGHSMNIMYESEGEESMNINGCVICHTGKTAEEMMTKTAASQAGIKTKLEELRTLLIDRGWLNETTDLWTATTSKPIKARAIEVKAMYNYKFVEEDGSYGVHNPSYAMALLQNSIEALQK